MADFLPAYEAMIVAEGGYQDHTVPGDTGGRTYAGIARNPNPQWPGWAFLDRGETPPTPMVRDWYKANFWDPIHGDELTHQSVAYALFNLAVNTSAAGRPATAVKLAQVVVGATPDGSFGPRTLELINAMDPVLFVRSYALAHITRYRDIVSRNKSQVKFLEGWISRALKVAA